jgi:GTP-binding protein
VFVKGDPQLGTLLDYTYRTHWKAERGQHGKGANQTGRSGEDMTLPVPLGTQLRLVSTGEMLGEILRAGDVICVARGGRGGRGNAQFATPTHRAPREWEPGEPGQDREIELVLKLIADVGLLGPPNAGKSTLLAAVSAARPRIADYPFTTLTPGLGVVALSGGRSFVMADIPGIIEGAHEGRGLGDRFLQHVERTRVLAYLVPLDATDLQAAYDTLRQEVGAYGAGLAEKPHIVVLTKADLWPVAAPSPSLRAPQASAITIVSAVARRGLEELLDALWRLVIRERQESAAAGDD